MESGGGEIEMLVSECGISEVVDSIKYVWFKVFVGTQITALCE